MFTGVDDLPSLFERLYQLDIVVKELNKCNLRVFALISVHLKNLIYLNFKFILEYLIEDEVKISNFFTLDAVLGLKLSFLTELKLIDYLLDKVAPHLRIYLNLNCVI